MFKSGRFFLAVLMTSLLTTPALAHHPIGGIVPQTLWQGFISGIAHPVIGIDHLAFLIAFGLLIGLSKSRFFLTGGFVIASAIGTAITLSGTLLLFSEIVIAGSVLLVGGLALLGKPRSAILLLPVSMIAGIFHGYAFGGAVIGAEASPIFAYLAGLAVIQSLIIIAIGSALKFGGMVSGQLAIHPRLTAAVCAGIGLTFLTEHAESLIF